ncbi:MAG TPA: hypothetical protein VEL07_01495 [Planctomycetota bacterium]|nr:hypothetical protein [Planctomycetota bacterium]
MRAVLRILLGLLSLVFATGLVTAYLRPGAFELAVEHLRKPEGRLLMLSVATLMAVIPLGMVIGWLRAHRRAREISYTTEGGRVSVSLIAVEEALTRAVEGETCVKKAAVRVYEDRVKRQVIIDAVMTLWEVANVTERNRTCAQILRRRFNELMPEQTAVAVNLTVHRLTPRRDDAKHATEAPAAAAPAAAIAAPVAERGISEFGDALAEGPSPASSSDSAITALRDDPTLPPDAIGEDELFVGPSYPVDGDDEDAEDYLGRPIPVKKKSR